MSDNKFNPADYLITMRSGKKYLPVNARIAWFREQHPDDKIKTGIIVVGDVLIARALVIIGGINVATGHATIRSGRGTTWEGREVEKAETAAIGRALATAGYGTLNAGDEFDESENLADAPVAAPDKPPKTAHKKPAPLPAVAPPEGYEPRASASAEGEAPAAASDDDLRTFDNAKAFIAHWRAQGITDKDILAALNVSRISEWTQGRAAADNTIRAYIEKESGKANAPDTN